MKDTDIICPPPYTTPVAAVAENVFFGFEEDFVEDNVRCIPMIVRFKLDACGIKLKLQEWSKLLTTERRQLSEMECSSRKEVNDYRQYLQRLIKKHTGATATNLPVTENAAWANTDTLPALLEEKLAECNWRISPGQWRRLNNLQRFVLLKLCRPGHENHNFPKAMQEFGLV